MSKCPYHKVPEIGNPIGNGLSGKDDTDIEHIFTPRPSWRRRVEDKIESTISDLEFLRSGLGMHVAA